MSKQSTYFFTLEVAPLQVGQTYEHMPLHCTLMHRFHSSLSADELTTATELVFAGATSIQLVPGERTAFGPNRVLVNVLQPTVELLALHGQLYEVLNNLGVEYTESDWVGPGYKPHVTDQGSAQFRRTKPLASQYAYLIEVEYPLEGSRRFIKHRFKLGDGRSDMPY